MDSASAASMDLFLEACAAAAPLRVDVSYPSAGGTVRRVFPQPFVLVGRHPHSDLLLVRSWARPCHTYLQVIGGRVFYVNLHETGKNGGQIRPPRSGWLDPGQALGSRHFALRLCEDAPGEPSSAENDWNPLEPAPAGQPGIPSVSLELLNGTTPRPPRPITRLLTLVGKSPSCGLRLVGASVADFHCSLLRTPIGAWVVDLFGPGGVYVNEKRVAWARLKDGDRLLVGKFYYRLRYQSAPPLYQGGDFAGEGPQRDERTIEAVSPAVKPEALSAGAALPVRVRPASAASSVPSLARQPEPVGFPAAPLPPFLHQFGLMQQQMSERFEQVVLLQQRMFEDFHQAVLTALKSITDVHRDEAASIQGELDRLQNLTRSLGAMHAALRGQLNAAKQKPASLSLHDEEVVAVAGPLRGEPGGPDGRGPRPDDVQVEGDGLAWLCQRMTSLQEERQNLWQRVMSRVLGLGHG